MMQNFIEDCNTLEGFQVSCEGTEELGMYKLNLKDTGNKATPVGEHTSVLLLSPKSPEALPLKAIQIYYHIVSVGESGSGLVGSSAQGLIRLKSKCHPGL